MMNTNDHVLSFLNSLQVVKDAFSPFESGIRKAVKDLDHCWSGSKFWDNSYEVIDSELYQFGDRNSNQNLSCSFKRKSCHCVVNDDKKKGFCIKVPVKAFFWCIDNKVQKNENSSKELKVEDVNEMGTCSNCLQFAFTWSLLSSGFANAFPSSSKASKEQVQDKSYACSRSQEAKVVSRDYFAAGRQSVNSKQELGNNLSIEYFMGYVCEQLMHNLHKFELRTRKSHGEKSDSPQVNWFLENLKFARMSGNTPSNMVGTISVKEEGDICDVAGEKEHNGGNSSQKLANALLNIPLSNVERFRSTLSTMSFTELIELVPQLVRASKEYPDKKKLFSVQDFFRYTEAEGRRFFEELDRDGDGQVTLEDLEVVMRKRKLPQRYAREFLQHTRSHLFSRSFGWKQFFSLMEQKESTILRAYTSLCLSKSGTLQKSEILASLGNAGLPANEENAIAMLRFLNADTEESISYGHFRNFMLLLPTERLQEDPRSIWFEASTVVAVPPPVELPASSVLKSALAGGLSCALSCSLLFPVDTIKTRVQASTLTFPEIISTLPQIGVRGLYRGSLPAIFGQFSSHGLRTGIFEASKLVLVNFAPTLTELQVQSVASFCSTLLGTAVRIPCEVLKQRLQAGLFDNVGEAILGTWNQDGLKGFFRGTGATLFREVPFYVAGMGLYAESKKGVQRLLGRELEPWETIAVGALSGGFAAVVTTPFDVMKTRMMTAPGGRSISMQMVALTILRHEGPLGLFKGAVPRFFWIAPLGAMNFAGYELAKKAMVKNEEQQQAGEHHHLSKKRS
ncbi:mitochondrial substrate carrier family protein C-like [Impatiens glandulifera]|uniref:mitochondrial substrate carrier family protein C-like n=1 Tax=Impatiens glandulifera TaxID=253017 RepID=UPI001FB1003D|nr:mitochondrial substrate carrier family protein C-like [Impatiens glandulifera]